LVTLFIASSLDGFIAGPKEDLSWLFHDRDYGYKKFLKSIDTVVMGRKTYDFGKQYSNPPFPGKRNIVVTKNKKLPGTSSEIIFCSLNQSYKLISSKGTSKNIWLVGGSSLISGFINKDFLDKIVLSVHPVILGQGIPLFKKINKIKKLKLIGCKFYSSGLVQLTYRII